MLQGLLRAVHQILEASRHEAVRQGLQVGAQRLRRHPPAQLAAGLRGGRTCPPAFGQRRACAARRTLLRDQPAEYRYSRTLLKASVENGCVMAVLGLG